MDTYLLRIHIKCTEIKLIQTRTEPLRNKQVFTEQLILKGAIFILGFLII